MEPIRVDQVFDAGDLGCGELLVLLVKQMKALAPGQVLQVVTTDPGAAEDLPAWCRLRGHELIRVETSGGRPSYWIRRGG